MSQEPLKLNLPKIESSLLEWSNKKELGQGGFGVVFKIKHKHFGDVAVKIVRTDKRLNIRDQELLLSEAKKLQQLPHEHMLCLRGIIVKNNEMGLVTEFVEHGTIRHIQKKFKPAMEWKCKALLEVANAMTYLHERSPCVLHNDLKASNILITSKFSVKIADFGLAEWQRLSREYSQNRTSVRGTPTHICPEALSDVHVSPTTKFDVYAYAILMWEVLTGLMPYEGFLRARIFTDVKAGIRPSLDKLPENTPKVFQKVLTSSWDQDPTKRMEFTEIRARLQPVIDEQKSLYLEAAIDLLQKFKDEVCRDQAASLTEDAASNPREAAQPNADSVYIPTTENFQPEVAMNDERVSSPTTVNFDSPSSMGDSFQQAEQNMSVEASDAPIQASAECPVSCANVPVWVRGAHLSGTQDSASWAPVYQPSQLQYQIANGEQLRQATDAALQREEGAILGESPSSKGKLPVLYNDVDEDLAL